MVLFLGWLRGGVEGWLEMMLEWVEVQDSFGLVSSWRNRNYLETHIMIFMEKVREHKQGSQS